MRYAAILAAFLALAGTASAQGHRQPSVRTEGCLVVSADGAKSNYRDSWGYGTQKRTFKDSDLWKIAKQGVHVMRLEKEAPDMEVKVSIAKCQRAILNDLQSRATVVPFCTPCCESQVRIIPD